MSVIDIYNTTNKYGIIYTDPPWKQRKTHRACRLNQTRDFDYPTLPLEEIKDIHAKAFSLCDDKCNVFMWTIDKYIWQTESMMNELGFKVHARMIWDKGNGIAAAFTVRFSHEYLIWFYRAGHMLRPSNDTRGKYTTVFREKSTSHSHKPECVYRMLDDMFPDAKKLEMFARNQKDGWDCWGNEINKFGTVA